MRQVHVQDPWAGLAYGTEREVISELMSRIQVLENRLRDLEELVKGIIDTEPEQQTFIEAEPAAVGG